MRTLRKTLRRWWWLLATPLIVVACAQSAHHAFYPEDGSTIRAVALWLKDHRQPGQPIYLAADGNLNDGSPRQRPSGRNIELLCYWRPSPPLYLTLGAPGQIHGGQFWIVYSVTRPGETPNYDPAEYGQPVAPAFGFTNAQAGAILYQRP